MNIIKRKNRALIKYGLILLLSSFFYSFYSKAIPNTEALDRADLSVWRVTNSKISSLGFFVEKELFYIDLEVLFLMLQTGDISDIQLISRGPDTTLQVEGIYALSSIYKSALLKVRGQSQPLEINEEFPKSTETLFVSTYSRGAFKRMQKIGDILYENKWSYSFFVNHILLSVPDNLGSSVLNEQGQLVGYVGDFIGNTLTVIKPKYLRQLMKGSEGSKCHNFLNIKNCINREIDRLILMARSGFFEARHQLAFMKYYGLGVAKSIKEAFILLKGLADIGDVPAKRETATLYLYGKGTKPNMRQAFSLYEEASNHGDVTAKFYLAGMLHYTQGTGRDLVRAFFLYKELANQGHIRAQYTLAFMYARGEGTKKDADLAIHWLEQAASNGHIGAEKHLPILKKYLDSDKDEQLVGSLE